MCSRFFGQASVALMVQPSAEARHVLDVASSAEDLEILRKDRSLRGAIEAAAPGDSWRYRA